MKKERDFIPRIQNRKEETVVGLESSGTPHREKIIAGQYTNRDSEKYSNKRGWPKECQKNIQNIKRNMVEYWSGKDRYTWKHNSQSTLEQWCDRNVYE